MDRGPWQATVHRVARVGHDLVTKPINHQPEKKIFDFSFYIGVQPINV